MEEFVDFISEKEPVLERKEVKRAGTLSKISRFLTNKFLLTAVAFAVIMVFLDKNDLLTTIERKKELNELEQSKAHFLKELSELKQIKTNLETNPAVIEKVAREKYLMKRENEDLFLTEDRSKKSSE